MSWLQKLYETYENSQSQVGAGTANQVPLLPVGHTTQIAQIEIVIDQHGNFKRARVVPKDEARTIIPCTEVSGGRAGKKPETHPLCDKLQYVAQDFPDYGGEVTSGFAKDPQEPHRNYRDLLKKWCASTHAHPKARAVLRYIERGQVIRDLLASQILFTDVNGKLLSKWDKKANKEVPEIFSVSANAKQSDAFVRWVVEDPGDPQSAVWTDESLYVSWQNFYAASKTDSTLCYVTGTYLPTAEQHTAKIRNDGDKAKLISSNDTSGYTFRGRFLNAEQACGVGYEVTQKAHNALRWLIARQGYRRGDQAIVAWSTAGYQLVDPLADSFSILGLNLLDDTARPVAATAQELALKLKQRIAGYSAILGDTAQVVVMGLGSATPGRMAISFYRELTGSEFLARIDHWHATCAWVHDYRTVELPAPGNGKPPKKHIRFAGAPAPNDIAEAAYGSKVDDHLRKTTVERILPCIIDGQKIPRDLVESAVRRAANRVGMEDWEWNKTLSIACALYKKRQTDYKKGEFTMALDAERKTRDYLYGRLLALAESLEQWALKEGGENRPTTAARLMHRFADHPFTTWRTIELALAPHKARLGGKSAKRQRLISEVMAMFTTEDFTSDKKLSGEFLLGYHCQRDALWQRKEEAEQDEQ